LERRLRAAAADKVVKAGGPVLPWSILDVETRLVLLEAMDACETEDDLAEMLDARPELRAAVAAVLDAVEKVAAE